MKAELTAENRPACRTSLYLALSFRDGNKTTDEDKRRVQVLVILFRVIPVKLFRFFAVCGKEVGPGIVGPEWFDELFEGGMEARSGCQKPPGCHGMLE